MVLMENTQTFYSWDMSSMADLIYSLDTIPVWFWQIYIINKQPELLSFLSAVHKPLSVKHIELYKLLQLLGGRGTREDKSFMDGSHSIYKYVCNNIPYYQIVHLLCNITWRYIWCGIGNIINDMLLCREKSKYIDIYRYITPIILRSN